MATVTEAQVERALRYVEDPEMGLNVVDLGLIQGISVDEADAVVVTMTLTTQHCPMGALLTDSCRQMVAHMTRATDVRVDLVWEPAWTPDRISPAGREQLQMK
jgi:metal-sulfur cluster biosynthetic enzyme